MIIITAFLNYTVNLISGILPLTLLLVCGIYLSVKGNFFQITRFPESVKAIFKTLKNKDNSFTAFKAVCTSLSAAVGTGNIAGVAGAISIGGAGAVFWMWISATLGMCIKSAEIVLSILYREKNNGAYLGGPIFYIKNGLSPVFKPLAYIFCLLGIPSVFCTGNITQTNAAITSISNNFAVKLVMGILFSSLTFIVINGGLRTIGNFTEKIVPLMSLLYITICTTCLIFNIDFLPTAFKMIIVGAFKPRAVTGGIVGSFITTALIGSERGIFSNEAGLGTSGIAHSSATDSDKNVGGLFGIFEVFVDTILLCTLTALTILCSNAKIPYGENASSELVISAVSQFFGKTAQPIISVMLCLFAFSSIIGWAVYGNLFAKFLTGEKGVKIFTFIYPFGCILGALADVKFVWDISAFFNGIMLLINLPVIILLSEKALKYIKKRKNNV